jgi:hypothetical protein
MRECTVHALQDLEKDLIDEDAHLVLETSPEVLKQPEENVEAEQVQGLLLVEAELHQVPAQCVPHSLDHRRSVLEFVTLIHDHEYEF